jgi:hypothetical protein
VSEPIKLIIEGERANEVRELAYLLTIKRARGAGELHDQVDELAAVTIAVSHELAFQRATVN